MRYLVLITGGYGYRRRVPGFLAPFERKKFWKQSFRTQDRNEAERRARALACEHDTRIASFLDKSVGEKISSLLRQMDVHGNDNGIRQAFDFSACLKCIVQQARGFHHEEAALQRLAPSARMEIDSHGGIAPSLDHALAEWRDIALEHAKSELQFLRTRNLQQRHDENDKIAIRRNKLFRLFGELKRVGIEIRLTSALSDPQNPKMRDAVTSWFGHRRQRIDTVNRHTTATRRFMEMFGTDIAVKDISRKMIEEYVDALTQLTDHRRLPSNMRGGMHFEDGLDSISAPTVARHLISMKAFLTYCVERDWLDRNVATPVKPPRDTRPLSERRRALTRTELKVMYNQAVCERGEDSDLAWIIRLSAYTGCRLEEVAQLQLKNLYSLDNVWVIEIDDRDGRQIKSLSSHRRIPLHNQIKEPFLRWLQGRTNPNELIFRSMRKNGGRYSSVLSGMIARLMDRAELSDRRLAMHSTRHFFKQALSDAGVDGEVRRILLGHRPLDTHESSYAPPSIQTIDRELQKVRIVL